MAKIQEAWAKPAKPGTGARLRSALKPQGPLKPRVEQAISKLQQQISRLDTMVSKLKERDANLFGKIVEATQNHDTHTSKVLSSELVEVRKVTKVINRAKISLEKIEMRLMTCHDLGDTMVAIMPTMQVMKDMKPTLAKFMPNADAEITNMANMLGGMMTESFTNDDAFSVDPATGSEAENILAEAAAVATGSFDGKFPDAPASTGTETAKNSERFM